MPLAEMPRIRIDAVDVEPLPPVDRLFRDLRLPSICPPPAPRGVGRSDAGEALREARGHTDTRGFKMGTPPRCIASWISSASHTDTVDISQG